MYYIKKRHTLIKIKQDGEVALMDATVSNVSNIEDCPPYSPFHFLRAHHDNKVPVSRLQFHWCHSSDKGSHQLHLAIVSGSLVRVANMSTFEIFYAYHAGSRIRDIRFCPYGPERILVTNDIGITESVTWKPWQFIYGERWVIKVDIHVHCSSQCEIVFSSHQACTIVHSKIFIRAFNRIHRRRLKDSRRTSATIDQAQFAGVFQSAVKSLSFAGDSNSLAVPCGSEVILCDSSSWLPSHDTTKRTPISRLKVDTDQPLEQVVYSSDSAWLAITTQMKVSESVCDLMLYSCSGTSDDIAAWKLQHRRSLSSKGENVCSSATANSGP